jgi:transcriptional regulator with XRE-family HTH domain
MDTILEPFVTSAQVLIVPRRFGTFGSMNHGTKSAFSSRLNEALDDAGVPPKFDGRQVAVAKMFGVSQKGARKWLEGEGLPTLEKCIEIATRLNVHVEWLATGRGPKREGESALDALPAQDKQETFDFIEFKLTKAYSGETLARYLLWLDHMRRNPPGGKT